MRGWLHKVEKSGQVCPSMPQFGLCLIAERQTSLYTFLIESWREQLWKTKSHDAVFQINLNAHTIKTALKKKNIEVRFWEKCHHQGVASIKWRSSHKV